jgi:2-oxoglutarate ferredoxin oxidoreductase subunit beta
LTTGQASPTTEKGHKTKSTPRGNVELPINPLALALVSGATYVARGFSGENKHLADLIAGGIAHHGFALVDIFSPCVTYNTVNTYPWFKQRVYKLEDEQGYDPADMQSAFKKSFEWDPKIPLGLFYKGDELTYEDSEPALKKGPLVRHPLKMEKGLFEELVEEFY